MKKNTVLTKEHITILQKFLITSVDVASKRADGEVNEQKIEIEKKSELEKVRVFGDHYLDVVSRFKQEFYNWNNGMPIDISKVRGLIIPLLERLDELDLEAFTLYLYADAKNYIYHHSVAISILSAFLGKEMGHPKGECLQIGLAGLLCDCGMTKVDQDIITKGGPLTGRQIEDIKNHPVYSSRMVENLPTLTPAVKVAILQHHEGIDGSGYPMGLSNNEINNFARILAVSDTYHAMTSERFYKKQQSPFKVVDELLKEQFSRLDPKVIRVFINSLTKRSIGKTVKLSNNQKAKIIFFHEDYPTRPLVKLTNTEEIISLQSNPNLHIEEFV